MSEKEIKKIDEKSEEEVSGGAEVGKGSKKILEQLKKFNSHVMLAYGGPEVFKPTWLKKKLRDKENEKGKKPEEALTPSQPQTEEKK